MTAIDITALTDEQKAKIAADYAASEKAKKEKKAADKKLLKGLENDVVLKVIDFFIDKIIMSMMIDIWGLKIMHIVQYVQ